MVQGIGDMLARQLLAFAGLCFVVGAALVAFIAWGVPWLWSIAKPWLHAVSG